MANFAFAVPPLTGHVNPTLSLGGELLKRGHKVSWISIDPSLKEKLPRGGELLLIQYDQVHSEYHDNQRYIELISGKSSYGIESIKFLYEEVLIPLNRYMFNGIMNFLEKRQPHLLINDHQLFAGAIAACQKDISYVTSVTAPAAINRVAALPKMHEWETKQITSLQNELGLSGSRPVACSDLMTLVLTSRKFFGETNLPGNYRFVGPVLDHRFVEEQFDWQKLRNMGERRKILVSIGTTFNQAHKRDFFSKVVEAFRDQEIGVIMAADEHLFDSWPDNFLVQKKVPQMALLPYLDAVVCHGGQNTVSETLMHGLPLVVIPIAYDQSYVAGRVLQTGCGLRLNFKRFKAAHLKNAVREVLDAPQYKNTAREIQLSFERSGGTVKAAVLLESILLYKQQ